MFCTRLPSLLIASSAFAKGAKAELRRITLLRIWVNRGKQKGRSF
jgi:hypothetical protein